MDFGQALYCVRDGKRVARGIWVGSEVDKWVTLNGDTLMLTSREGGLDTQVWTITSEDVLAEDWEVVE